MPLGRWRAHRVQPSTADAPSSSSARLPSFLLGGFEGADHRNSSGRRVAMLDVTGHAGEYVRNYARLRGVGIRVARESIGWSRAERDGRFDFDCALRRAEAARKAGIEIIWTLWHYGIPEDVDLFDAALADRFAAFAHAAATVLRDSSHPAPIFCPVNEISFLAWAVCESTFIHPHRGAPGPEASARGFVLKKRLVQAAIAGCDAIRDAIPGARMLHVDPLVHIVAPAGDPARYDEAARVRNFQFQAWDMLTGRLAAELGGAPRHLDFVGVNYYHGNQFELDTDKRLHWHVRDPRRMPFRMLLRETFARYQKPVLIAETSHFGIGRERWILEIAREVRAAMREGVGVAGLCLYPIIDRPDWEAPSHWHHSGLWDHAVAGDGTHFDRLQVSYLSALRHVQRWFGDSVGDVSYGAVDEATCRETAGVRAERAECAIVGAGIAGLCAAWHYGAGSVLLEGDAAPGGSRRSVADEGFLFDVTANILDGRDAFDELYRRALADNVAWREPRIGDARRIIRMREASTLTPFLDAFGAMREPLGYPLRGGTQALIDGLLPLLETEIIRGAEVVRILPRQRTVVLDDGHRIAYERLIVTLPVPTLLALCDVVPDEVVAAAKRLRTLALRTVNIGFRGSAPTNADWLLDNGDAIFDRVFMHGNVTPRAYHPGHFALTCEIVHAASRPLTLHGSALVRRCVDDCVRAGLIASRDAVIVTHETDLPIACVIDDDPRATNLRTITRFLETHGIGFTGSRGDWEPGRCRSLLASARDAAHAARRSIQRRHALIAWR